MLLHFEIIKVWVENAIYMKLKNDVSFNVETVRRFKEGNEEILNRIIGQVH